MLYSKKQLLLSLLIGTTCVATPKSLFEEMIEEVNEMEMRFERRMNRIHEEMKKAFSAPLNNDSENTSLSISENKDANCLEIIINPLIVKEKNFDAHLDQETGKMAISTPAGSIYIQTNRHFISAGFNHHSKQDTDLKDAKNTITLSSYIQNAKTLHTEIALEETQIEYDQDSKKLVISIPFRKKVFTKIPVTIKETGNIKESSKNNEK